MNKILPCSLKHFYITAKNLLYNNTIYCNEAWIIIFCLFRYQKFYLIVVAFRALSFFAIKIILVRWMINIFSITSIELMVTLPSYNYQNMCIIKRIFYEKQNYGVGISFHFNIWICAKYTVSIYVRKYCNMCLCFIWLTRFKFEYNLW